MGAVANTPDTAQRSADVRLIAFGRAAGDFRRAPAPSAFPPVNRLPPTPPVRHPESPRECREALDCGGSTPLLALTGGLERSVECGAALDGLGHSTLLLRAKEKRRRAAAVQRLSPRSTAPAHPRLAKLRIPEQKARVKDGHTTHGESSFGKKLWCVLIVLFLGGIGWQMWKLNAYNNAVRQAKEAGFEWTCDDAIILIRQDWHNALKKETWGEHPRVLEMRKVPDIGRYREMLHHLNPTELYATKCKDENVDALKGLSALQTLDLGGSTALQNVDALKGLTGLQELGLVNCKALKSVDALKGLTDLQKLYLTDSDELQNVDALKRLTALQTLALSTCTALQNVDGLKGLTTLQRLYLDRCPALQNVDALKGLTSLQDLDLYRCYKIPAAALRELRAALPKTIITFPDGSISPPQ